VEVVITYTDLCAFGFVVTPICKARGCIWDVSAWASSCHR
jgi:hypothetical protein